jgi:hypothetical protein
MEHRYPGFGPAPFWRLPVAAGGSFLLLGGLLWLSGERRDGLIIAICAAVPLFLGLARLGRFRVDRRRLRDRPPSVHERTTIILDALEADREDLAANARSAITPAQWRRIYAQTGTLGLINGPLPTIQVVEGPAMISAQQLRHWVWYDLRINGVLFRSSADTVVNGMQRDARYRVYFIDLPTPDRLHETTRIVLSAEGL